MYMKRYFNFIFLILLSVQLSFAQETVLSRPQEPIKPYPYISEDVVFSNENANISLSGTLTYPKDVTNVPVVILISGSGPQDRNEELLGHKPFLVLSDYLTKNGIAVLRYDERGVGESEGNFGIATTLDFASDVRSAIDYLKTRKDINSSKMGLIGHSEGGLISFMLAAENDDIAFLVSMAGPGMRGDSLLQMQRKAVFKANGASDTAIEQNEILLIKLQDIVVKYSAEDIVKNIDSIAKDILPAPLCDNIDAKKGLVGQLMMLSAPWFSYFMTYDPTDALKNIRYLYIILHKISHGC